MRAISVDIFKSRIGDCSNHGISERHTNILLLHESGNIEVDPNCIPENLCCVITRVIAGKPYKHIEPVSSPKCVGWMSGGCICYSCDSRFHDLSEYPLKLHDRQETVEQYSTYD